MIRALIGIEPAFNGQFKDFSGAFKNRVFPIKKRITAPASVNPTTTEQRTVTESRNRGVRVTASGLRWSSRDEGHYLLVPSEGRTSRARS